MINAMPRLNASGHRTIGNWRGAVALCALAKVFGTFRFDLRAILDFDFNKLTPELVEKTFSSLRALRTSVYGNQNDGGRRRLGNFDLVCQMFGKEEGISDENAIGGWSLPTGNPAFKPDKVVATIDQNSGYMQRITVSEAEMELVAQALPQQPWPPGIQQRICESVGLDKKVVRLAVKQLIASGTFLNQYTGVVVDANDNIVAVDPLRADPKYVVGTRYSGY